MCCREKLGWGGEGWSGGGWRVVEGGLENIIRLI